MVTRFDPFSQVLVLLLAWFAAAILMRRSIVFEPLAGTVTLAGATITNPGSEEIPAEAVPDLSNYTLFELSPPAAATAAPTRAT